MPTATQGSDATPSPPPLKGQRESAGAPGFPDPSSHTNMRKRQRYERQGSRCPSEQRLVGAVGFFPSPVSALSLLCQETALPESQGTPLWPRDAFHPALAERWPWAAGVRAQHHLWVCFLHSGEVSQTLWGPGGAGRAQGSGRLYLTTAAKALGCSLVSQGTPAAGIARV